MRILTGLLLALPLLAQNQAFDVATLKLSPSPEGNLININLGTWGGGRLTMGNVTLGDLVKYAYGLVSDEQVVPPTWNKDVRFDVEALAPVETPPAELRLRMRALLAERLHLTLKREPRTLVHLALLAPAGASKLAPAAPGQPAGTQVRGRISHPAMSMQLLASLLSRFERQTVVDETHLEGNYSVKVEWAPDPLDAPISPEERKLAAAAAAERPSLFTAVREQLGLRLESRRAPLEVVVVEQASRVPEEN